MPFTLPQRYSDADLEKIARQEADAFKNSRHTAEKELASFYHDRFVQAVRDVRHVLSETDNLKDLRRSGQRLLVEGYLDVLRNMDCPTVSADDFKNLSGTGTDAKSRFHDDQLSGAALEYLERNLNRDLFPWLTAGSEPRETDVEAAIVSVAALVADQKTKTSMRTLSSKVQESAVRVVLTHECGFEMVPGDNFDLMTGAPRPGQVFKRETLVGGTKADIVFGLFDGRAMCLECKVSNSEVNSFKRLNHEVVEKVKKWEEQFGRQCVSGAVLQGCFKPTNLVSAQEAGVNLFWSSDLGALVRFIESTRAC